MGCHALFQAVLYPIVIQSNFASTSPSSFVCDLSSPPTLIDSMKSYVFCKTGIFTSASVGSRLVLYCRKFDSQKNWLPEVWAWWSKTERCQHCPGLSVEWGSLLLVASALANTVKEARLLLLHCVTGDPSNKHPTPSPTSSTLPGRQLALRKYLLDEWIENYGKGIKKNKRGLGDRTSRRGLEESRSKEAFVKRWKVKMK